MKKTETLTIRLTASERKRLEMLAAEDNRSVSNYVHTYAILPLLRGKASKLLK